MKSKLCFATIEYSGKTTKLAYTHDCSDEEFIEISIAAFKLPNVDELKSAERFCVLLYDSVKESYLNIFDLHSTLKNSKFLFL